MSFNILSLLFILSFFSYLELYLFRYDRLNIHCICSSILHVKDCKNVITSTPLLALNMSIQNVGGSNKKREYSIRNKEKTAQPSA